jgi:hypothetical protein
VRGTLGEQAFDEFQAERDGLPHEFWVIIGGKRGATISQGISQLVDREFPHGTPRYRHHRCQQEDH